MKHDDKRFGFLGLFIAGLAAVALGYVALYLERLTLAPALLVIGYCVLIPWALFRLGHGDRDRDPAPSAGE